jgi:Type IV secretion system pilin
MNGDQVLEKVITEVFSPLYAFVTAIAFLYFMYGVVMFIINMNDPEKRNIGKSHLLYGVIGLFIILSVGGILKFFNEIFDGMFVF